MCNTETNTTTRNWNEWKDNEGRFHRRVITETVTGPVKKQENQPQPTINFGIPKEFMDNFSGFWNSMQPKEAKNFFGNNPTDKPLIDMKALVENCKKTLGQMGVKLEDLFKSEDKEEKSAEDLVEETKKYDKPKTKEQVKPIKIVYNKSKDLKTEKPTNNKGGNNGKDKKNFKKSY